MLENQCCYIVIDHMVQVHKMNMSISVVNVLPQSSQNIMIICFLVIHIVSILLKFTTKQIHGLLTCNNLLYKLQIIVSSILFNKIHLKTKKIGFKKNSKMIVIMYYFVQKAIASFLIKFKKDIHRKHFRILNYQNHHKNKHSFLLIN